MGIERDLILDYLSLLKDRIYGRKKQVKNCFSRDKNNGYNIEERELNRLYQKIKKQYTEIRVHSLYSTRIGEYVPRYMSAVQDSIQNAKKGILDVFVLTDCINHNARLSKIIGRNIHVIDEANVHIWEYILCHFPKVELVKYWNRYTVRDEDRFFKPEHTVRYFTLTAEEEKEGQYKKKFMGLTNQPFVCVSSRDDVYLHKIEPRKNWHYHDYRDSDINQLGLSAEYLLEKGITMVRMGRYVKDKVGFDNCIDYANQYYDELMDIVLMRDCKFYLGDTNGLVILPMALNRPVAFKNMVPFFNPSWSALPHNTKDLAILKKYYKKDEKRFLSAREMMQVDRQCHANGKKYSILGIEVIENSAEEILDLTMEMNARIDGEWIETPEDIELQKKFQDVIEEWSRLENIKENERFSGKIGTMFLRKNAFLLED